MCLICVLLITVHCLIRIHSKSHVDWMNIILPWRMIVTIPLTSEECKVAADRARHYPPGQGFSFVGREVTIDDLAAEGYDDLYDVNEDHPLSGPITANWWFEHHPEDIALG